jgi:predicted kinase
MIDPQELEAEQRNMRLLRTIVDLTAAILRQGNLTIPEAIELVQATRKRVLQLFPGKEDVYDLIYRARFERIIQERLGGN